jgi:hypothetical protein
LLQNYESGKENMGIKTWTFELDGKRKVVEVQTKYIPGRRTILIDGEIMEQTLPHWFDLGSEHRFKIDEHDCILKAKPTIGTSLEYELYVDEKLI